MRNNYNNKCITGYDDINIAFMHQSNKSEEKKLYINPYAKLDGVSKGVYIKSYRVNWYFKLSVSCNSLKFKYNIQYNHEQTLNNGNRRIRYVSHIRSNAPFINETIENNHILGIHTFWKIISDDLRMSQIFQSYSFW